MRDYLHPIADNDPLVWIVREQRTAFPRARAREAEMLGVGDRLFLFATRGCFHNPTRDRGRVTGLAFVGGQAERLGIPVRFGDREYPIGVRLEIKVLAPRRAGVELAPLVGQLATFPKPRAWSASLRRALVPLADGDGDLLLSLLEAVAQPYPAALPTYTAP